MVNTSHNKTIRIDAADTYLINSDNETIIINTSGAVIIKFPHMLKDNDRINIISVVAAPNVTINDFSNVLITTLTTDYGYTQVEYNTSADAYVSRSIVTPAITSMNADDVIVVPAGNITSTDVQAALEELDGFITNIDLTADNISVVPAGNITSTDVQAALEELDGFIDVIVQEGTTASNGLTKTLLDVQLGGTLTANTLVNSGSFYLDLLGNLRLRPATISATSQNKTLQLANTTGELSLVNKGIYYTRTCANAGYVLALAAPDGNQASYTNNLFSPLANVATAEYGLTNGIQSTKIADSTALDTSLIYLNQFPYVAGALAGKMVKIKLVVTIKPDKDIIAMPFFINGSGNVYSNEFVSNVGLPKHVPGVGYREGRYCEELKVSKIETEFVIDNASSIANMGYLAIYRNTGIAATDGLSASVTIYDWRLEVIQI